MRRMAILTTLVLGLVVAPARAQTCTCTGTAPPIDKRDGGDAMPLMWHSLTRQIASSPADGPLYCYERQVDNKSGREVTDVYWPVASYRKKSIDGRSQLCDATPVMGAVKNPDPDGPLTYNTGPTPYATRVRAPVTGWGSAMAALGQATPRPPLVSTIQIALRSAGVVTVQLTSSVKQDGTATVFHFEITSQAKAPVRVFWNIPVTAAFNSLDYTPVAPATVVATQPFVRDVRSADPVVVSLAGVHLYEEDGKTWLASGVASVYASALGAPRTPVNLPQPPNLPRAGGAPPLPPGARAAFAR